MKTMEKMVPSASPTSGYPDLFLPPGVGEYPRGAYGYGGAYGHAPPTPPSAGAGNVIRRLGWQSLVRYRWSTLALFLLLGAPGVIAAWMFHTPRYRSYADVEVPPIVMEVIDRNRRDSVIPLYKQHLATRAAQIRSPEVLERVLERPEIKTSTWYKTPPPNWMGGNPSHVERLLADLEVRPQSDANFIRVSIQTTAPLEAAEIVQAVVEEYRVWSVSQENRRLQDLRNVRSSELKNTELDIQQLERSIATVRRTAGTDDPRALLVQQRARREEMFQQRAELWRQERLAEEEEGRNTAAAAADANSPASQPAAPVEIRYYADAEWMRLSSELKRARMSFEAGAGRFGRDHPVRRQMEREVQAVEGSLQERQAQLDSLMQFGMGPTLGGQPINAATSPAERKRHYGRQAELLTQDIALLDDIAQRTLTQLNEMDDFKVRLEEKRLLRNALNETLKQQELQSQVQNELTFGKPLVPQVPSNSGRRFMMVGLALFGAAVVSAALAFTRAALNPQVHHTTDVMDSTQSPVLGFVPLLPDARRPSPEALALRNEYFRMIRTSLLERLPTERGSVILVASAGPGAGKTTVTELLGRSFAQCGKKTLVVDADLRRQTLGSRLSVRTSPGLVEMLQKLATDKEAIVPGEIGEPDCLPAGQLDSVQNSELLAVRAFKDHLQRWREKYDIVLLDGPPLLPVADGRIMASAADGAILVVREGHCRRSEVAHAVSLLCQATRRFLGTVFFGSSRSSQYASHYATYYGYGYLRPQAVSEEYVAVRSNGAQQ